MPSHQFKNLPTEKQDEITYVSLREFAERGYDLGSTNRIVEQAGISKGVLFKYFEDKQALFIYVCQVSFDAIVEAIPIIPCTDFFELLRKVTIQKIRFSKDRPLTYKLLARIVKDPHHPVYEKVLGLATAVSEAYLRQVLSILPNDVLRTGVSWEQVLSTVTWISHGLQEKYFTTLPDEVDEHFDEHLTPLLQELDIYFDIVKRGTYREVQPT